MTTTTIRLYPEQLERIMRALELLRMEEAMIGFSLAEEHIVLATFDAHCLRAVAAVIHEDAPELAKAIRKLDSKLKKKATVDWLRSKFGL